ncbi:MAG: ABC transporter ATP-binding protein [Deltaproteobacteria bacterium]|nr:ABC transporter ATP-binding protein [Deltaproteobacteria bacterium]
MTEAIKVEALGYAYGDQSVLTDLTFAVQLGGFFIIIGPNGSGKTTLMRAISGIIRPDTGGVRVMGRSIRTYGRKRLARTIALVPQITTVYFPFTVMETVLMGRSPHLGVLGFEREEDFETAEKAMTFTGINDLAGRKLDQLSGGELQRVFIARAICQTPEIILLDEPTASLDLRHQVRIMDLMEQLKEERGVTVVMVSHDVNLAAMYGDRLLLLKEGRAVTLGTPDQVLTFEQLEEAYGCTLVVDRSPLGDYPRVSPVPRKVFEKSRVD